MMEAPSSPPSSSLLAPPQPTEPRKRTLTCDLPGLDDDDNSCMKCDEDCLPKYLECGHSFCADCITEEVKVTMATNPYVDWVEEVKVTMATNPYVDWVKAISSVW